MDKQLERLPLLSLPPKFRFDRESSELPKIKDALRLGYSVRAAVVDEVYDTDCCAGPMCAVTFSLAPYLHEREEAARDCYPNVAFMEHELIAQLGSDTPVTRAMMGTLEAGFSFHLVAETNDSTHADLFTLVYILSDNS